MSIENMTPHDRLVAAISIVQHAILAEDASVDADKLFKPGGHFATASLELAERMLMDLLKDVERLEKPVGQEAS